MIDWNKSAELNNTTIDKLKSWFEKYPQSGKKVVAVCDVGNEVREVGFYQYRDLCVKCSHNTIEYRKVQSKTSIEQFSDPAAREADRLMAIERFSDPDVRAEMSRIKKQYNIDNPEWATEQSKRLLQYHIDNPEAGKEQGERLKNSDVHKAAIESQRGGFDIVNHHFIYDHDHPENHTVEITRSQHSAHHQWMIRSGLEVPHINVTEDNKDIFIRR